MRKRRKMLRKFLRRGVVRWGGSSKPELVKPKIQRMQETDKHT